MSEWFRLENAYFISQIALFAAALVGVVYAIKTYSIDQTKKGGVEYFRMMEMMEETNFVGSIDAVYKLRYTRFIEWTDDDKYHADRVARTLNKCGMMIKLRLIPKDLFLDHFSKRIVDCYEILIPFLDNGTASQKAIRWLPDLHILYPAAKQVLDRQMREWEIFPPSRRRL